MTLWIESFTERLLSASDTKLVPFKQRMALRKKGCTTLDIQRASLELMFRQFVAQGDYIASPSDLSSSAVAEGIADVRRRLAPFILPELAHIPIAFDVDARAVAEFAGADIKESVVEFARNRMREWQYTYFDFPVGTAALEDGWFVRAVIAIQEAPETSKWSAIIQNAPECEPMVLTWYVVENDGYHPGSLIAFPEDFSLFASCGKWSEFATNLAYLCAAAFGTMTLAQGDTAAASKQSQAAAERHHQISISALPRTSGYRVVSLLPPGTQRLATQPGASENQLLKHIRVRGHFKIIRYGKRWARYRLQWVNSYEKGPRRQRLETRVPLYKIQTAA